MKRKDLILFLALEFIAIAVAGLSFAMIESRLIAGFVAGAYFIGFASFIVWKTLPYPGKWTLFYWYPLLIHLFVISIPMVVTRALNSGQDFTEVHILGLEGPVFHRLSTSVFSVLILGTLADLIKTVWTSRPARDEAKRI